MVPKKKTYPLRKVKGTSPKADKARLAMPAGWRVSKTGKKYFEDRENRCDSETQRKEHGSKVKMTVTQLLRMMKKYEDKIRGRATEYIYALNAQGKKVFSRGDGSSDSCSTEGMPMGCAIVTHNHPSSSSFSPNDLGVAVIKDVGIMCVCSEKYDYTLKRKKGRWLDKCRAKPGTSSYHMQLEEAAHEVASELQYTRNKLQREKYNAMYATLLEIAVAKYVKEHGRLTDAAEKQLEKECSRKTNIVHSHDAMTQVAKHYGWEYTRTEHKGAKT